MRLKRLQYLVRNSVDNYRNRHKEPLTNMVSPYLDRPLRSIAEAEAERHQRSSKGNGGAGNADRIGAIWRPAGRVLARQWPEKFPRRNGTIPAVHVGLAYGTHNYRSAARAYHVRNWTYFKE